MWVFSEFSVSTVPLAKCSNHFWVLQTQIVLDGQTHKQTIFAWKTPVRQCKGNNKKSWCFWTLCLSQLPSTPKIKQQSSITNPHSETGHFHIKSMPKCGKFGAASTAGWGAGAAIFSPVGRVVLLQKGGSPPQTPPTFRKDSSPRIPDAIGSLHLGAPTEFRHCLSRS